MPQVLQGSCRVHTNKLLAMCQKQAHTVLLHMYTWIKTHTHMPNLLSCWVQSFLLTCLCYQPKIRHVLCHSVVQQSCLLIPVPCIGPALDHQILSERGCGIGCSFSFRLLLFKHSSQIKPTCINTCMLACMHTYILLSVYTFFCLW